MASLLRHRWLRPLFSALVRRTGRPLPIDTLAPDRIRTIVVISSTAVGDTLMTLPTLHALRERFPAARLVLLAHRRVAPLMAGQPGLDRVIALRGLGSAWQLRRERPDAVLIAHGNEPEASRLAWLSGARYVIKHPHRHPSPELLSTPVIPSDYDPLQEHGIVNRLRAAAWLGAATGNTRMAYAIPAPRHGEAEGLLARHGIQAGDICVAFQAGAANLYKMWPADSFMLLAKRLLAEVPRCKVVLLGSGGERELNAAIAQGVRDPRVVNLSGATPLELLPAVLSRMQLLVTNDTGTMHMAIAVDTPTLSLFVPTEDWGVGPIQRPDLHRVIKKQRTCDPCLTKACRAPFCMSQITVDEVLSTARAMLASLPGQP